MVVQANHNQIRLIVVLGILIYVVDDYLFLVADTATMHRFTQDISRNSVRYIRALRHLHPSKK
jgi:hypothetical protein